MPNNFLAAVLPRTGSYVLFTLADKRHVWAPSIKQLLEQVELRYEQQGVYFATASFQEPTTRTQANVRHLRSLRLDIDAGTKKFEKNPEGSYPTQRDALAALIAFSKAAQLAPSYIVSSGEGLHVYYALDEDLTPAQWASLAKALGKLCDSLELKADPTVTCDTARVLRPPGMLHPNGSRVTVLKATGAVYSVEQMRAVLGAVRDTIVEDDLPAPTRKYDTSINADVKSVEGPPKSVLKVIEQCGAMREAAEKRGDVPEPYWRAMLGIVKFTVEGATGIHHEMSNGYDGYDPDETEKKYNAYTAGPPTCGEFAKHSEACNTCPHAGKIKSPIQLGYMNDEQVAELPEELQPKEPEAVASPGMPWDGCLPPRFQVVGIPGKYTLQYTMKVVKDDDNGVPITNNIVVPVTNDIFWLGNWSEAAHSRDLASVTVHAWSGTEVKTYLMDQSLAAGSFDLLKWLAGKAIHISTDKKAGQAVSDYVKLSLQRIKNLAKRPKIDGRFGLRITSQGELICAQGNHVIWSDGTVQEAMLSEELQGPAASYAVPLPPSSTGEWDKTVWSSHVVPLARTYTDFMTKFYGVPGLEKYQLVAMLGLASPFMAFVTGGYTIGLELPKNGLSVSLYSKKSEQGKTALVEAVMLAYGNPAMLVADSNQQGSTDIGRMSKLSFSGTFPTSMDEMGGTKETSITNMISSVANGSGRTRGTKTGGFTTSQSWALINLITTNRSQRDMVSVGQAESAAIQYRLLELNVDDVVFDRADRDAYRAELPAIIETTKGALGAVINLLACKLGFAKLNKALVAEVKRADALLQAEQGARFQYRALGALLFLQKLLHSQGLAMFDEAILIDEFKKAHGAGVEYVVDNVLPDDAASLIDMMLTDLRQHTLITENETNRQLNRTTWDMPLNTRMPDKVVARTVTSLGITHVTSHALRAWCLEYKISDKDLLNKGKAAGLFMVSNPAAPNVLIQPTDLFKGTREAGASQAKCFKINSRRVAQLTGGATGPAAGNVIQFPAAAPGDPADVDAPAEGEVS